MNTKEQWLDWLVSLNNYTCPNKFNTDAFIVMKAKSIYVDIKGEITLNQKKHLDPRLWEALETLAANDSPHYELQKDIDRWIAEAMDKYRPGSDYSK